MQFGVPEGMSVTWIRPRRDRALSRGVQDRMIGRLGNLAVVDMDGGHDLMISQPTQLANVLNGMARRAFHDTL
jgi:hypothetical protein